MKNLMTNRKAITAGAVMLLIMSFITAGVYYSGNKSLKNNLNDEKLKTEKILSEKLSLEKGIEDFKSQINSLNGKNKELDRLLAQTSQRLNRKEEEVKRIVRENGNIKTLKRQIAELNQMKIDFESRITALNEKLANQDFTKDSRITELENKNEELAANIRMLNSMIADNYMVETTKRKGKLTVVAKRAKKISVSFKVPVNIVENITFKLTKPDGSKVEGKDKGISYRVVNDDTRPMASTTRDEIKISKKIEMTYLPKEKLKPGVYKIEVFNGVKYMGTCNVKLR